MLISWNICVWFKLLNYLHFHLIEVLFHFSPFLHGKMEFCFALKRSPEIQRGDWVGRSPCGSFKYYWRRLLFTLPHFPKYNPISPFIFSTKFTLLNPCLAPSCLLVFKILFSSYLYCSLNFNFEPHLHLYSLHKYCIFYQYYM